MAETVFILGAGASHEAGAPLMKDFLNEAQRLGRLGAIPTQDLDFVLRARDELRSAHSNVRINLRNLESLFAAFEMARLLGRLGNMELEAVQGLPEAMERLIAQTLGATISLSPGRNGEGMEPPEPFKAFIELVDNIRLREPRHDFPVSILTFNYDPCVDHALYQAGLEPNYCLNEARDDGVSVLKLHGSLNWAYCEQCRKVTWWSIGKCLATRRFRRDEIEEMGLKGRPLGRFLAGPHKYVCGHSGPYKPIIVPPTYNKEHRYENIKYVWTTAANELREAENVYVIGFSLPDTDQFFRYFCALGMMGGAYLRRFWVFDPSKEVEGRFRKWLGQEADSVFQYHQCEFSEATRVLSDDLSP